jgi:hypothetical protein
LKALIGATRARMIAIPLLLRAGHLTSVHADDVPQAAAHVGIILTTFDVNWYSSDVDALDTLATASAVQPLVSASKALVQFTGARAQCRCVVAPSTARKASREVHRRDMTGSP